MLRVMKMALMVMVTGAPTLALRVIDCIEDSQSGGVGGILGANGSSGGSGGGGGDSQVNSRCCPGERPGRKCCMHE